MSLIEAGRKAPAFTLKDQAGKVHKRSEYAGRPVVLYFYPKDLTSGCTLEGRDFRDLHAAFKRAKTAVFGISRDSCASHAKFRARERFPFELLSDSEEKACRLFDVIREKNMYGRKVLGIERSTFLIDASGKLAREWRKVKVAGHAEEVLEAAKHR